MEVDILQLAADVAMLKRRAILRDENDPTLDEFGLPFESDMFPAGRLRRDARDT